MNSYQTAERRRGGWTLRLISVVGLLAVVSVSLLAMRGLSKPEHDAVGKDAGGELTYKVTRGPLKISLLAPGSIKARNSRSITCEISNAEAKIIWIIPEGTIVEKGDKLVELEAAGLDDNLVKQRIDTATAQAAYDEAVEQLAIQESQNQSDLLAAQNKLELAELDLKKYRDGELQRLKAEKEAAISLAEAELKRAETRLEGTLMLQENEFVSRGEVEADELTVQKQRHELEKAKRDYDVLVKYEEERELSKLEQDVAAARGELERVQLSSRSELRTKQIAVESAKAKLELEQSRLQTLEHQMANTVIYAPEAGMVVYANDGNSWRGNDDEIKEGAQVRYRQKLIELPDFSSWIVETRVHESMIRQVEVGLPAIVMVDALPNQRLSALVEKIGVLPNSGGRWFMPDVKEYNVDLAVTTTTLPLKPGMSARSEIVLAELDDVLYVPVQSVATSGNQAFVWLRKDLGFVKHPIEIGRNNESFVVVEAGLNEGDTIRLNAPDQGGGRRVIERPSNSPEDAQGEAKPARSQERTAEAERDAGKPAADAPADAPLAHDSAAPTKVGEG